MRVVVVGAGAWGLPAAAELVRRGHEVAVVDRDGPGNALSSSSGPTRLWRVADPHRAAIRLGRRAVAAGHRLEQRLGRSIHLTTGLLWRDSPAALEVIRAAVRAEGVSHAEVAAADVAGALPGMVPDGRDALWLPEAGPLLAAELVAGCVRLVEAGGGRLLVGPTVASVAPEGAEGAGCAVGLEGGEVLTADSVVVCAGPGTPALLAGLGLSVPLRSYLEQVVHLRTGLAPEVRDTLPCLFDGPLADRDGPDDAGIYTMPTPGVGYKVGLDAPLRDLSGDDRSRVPDPRQTRAIATRASAVLPPLGSDVVDELVCCWTDSPDGWFVVDRVGSVVVACGDSGKGFKYAAVMGEVLADLAEGATPDPDVAAMSSRRFADRDPDASWHPTALGGALGETALGGTAWAGQPGRNSLGGTAWAEQPGRRTDLNAESDRTRRPPQDTARRGRAQPVTQQPHYQVTDPATGEVGETFPFATDAEVDAAAAAAAAAFGAWRERPVEERAAIARRAGELFAERAGDLAAIATSEMGKAPGQARDEAEFCADIFGYYADNGPGLIATKPVPGHDSAHVEYRPVGTIVGVMPWNYPYYQVARFAAPNLVVGNTMILKHAENCPGAALAIADVMAAAGVPEGVYVNLFATHAQVAALIADPRIQGVSLTGSERAGAAVAAEAGRHLKKVVLELGGSDPYIVLDSDDVDAAAETAWETRMENVGQACNSNKRMIVMDDIYDDFVAGLVRRAAEMKPRIDGAGDYAPMVSRKAAEGLLAQVQDAVDKGATLHTGGTLADGDGAFFAPAVLTGVTPQMRAYREELFGPVAVVYRISDDEEAVELANAVDYGLGAAVWSTDEDRAVRVASRLDVGMANVNTPAGEGADLPFGGTKRSGFGRELGPLGIEEFVNKRLFYVQR